MASSTSPWTWTGGLSAVALLACCVATKDPFLVRAQQATADVAPRVQEILGVGPFTYQVTVADEPLPDSMVAATSIDRCLVTFGREIEPHGDEALYYFAAHEVAHVYLRGHWETLPDWLEEGFADVVALEVIPSAREDAESHMRFHEGRYEAYVFVRCLGIESVQALVQRAHVLAPHQAALHHIRLVERMHEVALLRASSKATRPTRSTSARTWGPPTCCRG